MKDAVRAGAVLLAAALAGCATVRSAPPDPIVGAWYVLVPGAPFEPQMYLFGADGTMQQANPDAGDARTSDSDGFGAWERRGSRVVAKFVEVTADRATHAFVSRGEISMELVVDGDALNGTAVGRFYDAGDRAIGEPISATMRGRRVRP